MVSRFDELHVEFKKLCTREGQVQFITTRTELPDDCVQRVLVHLMAQPNPLYEEWNLFSQAKNAGISFEDYAVAMNPLMELSVEQAEARLQEIQARVDRGDDPELSEDETEKIRKLGAFVTTIASLSGEDEDIVMKVYEAVSALLNRQLEIIQQVNRLRSSGIEER